MRKTVAVGMVGCGFYAQNHLHAWSDLGAEGAVLSAVCDRDPARAEAAGAKFGVPHFTDMNAMLDKVEIGLLDIATRMDTHRELAAIAAERGVPAVVQKPFAPTWEECIAIVEKARKHQAWLAVHENFRFASAMRAVKKVLTQGTIGTPTWARLSWRTGFDVYRGQPYLPRPCALLPGRGGTPVLRDAEAQPEDPRGGYCDHHDAPHLGRRLRGGGDLRRQARRRPLPGDHAGNRG